MIRPFSKAPVVSVVRLTGVIGRMGPLRAGLTLQGLAAVLDRAFRVRNLKAVALAINSPGGSPVQSALIHRRIRALADERDVPILVFAEDVAASGGYWLACAGDEIYAHENSIIGSIGVISTGFGFTGLIERYGIERRVHTAGRNKSILDPFKPEDPDDVARVEAIQSDIHESFVELVKARRGKRLGADHEDIFSGAFWTGRRAKELGLIDGIGDMRTVLRDRFGEDIKMRVISARRGWARRRFGMNLAPADPGAWIGEAIATVEERLWWGRFGL